MSVDRIAAIARTAFALSLVAFAAPSSWAAVRTWCGPSGEQDWNAATNWVDEAVPTGEDTAYFPQNSVYHFNGTGKRRYFFKVTPPADFTGTILTTNELAAADHVELRLNQSFCPTVQLGVLDGATWVVAGDGTVIATDGVAARISDDFAGTIEVRKGDSFALPSTLNTSVRIVGAGEISLASGSQLSQAEAFAGSVALPEGSSESTATVAALQDASVTLADGQTLSFGSDALAYRPVTKIESFVDSPGMWSFNGTTWDEGNLPSGPFNPDPPYVKDGELWLTDEPAQLHTVWYTNRVFRLMDDWGMSFTYNPELPSGTRITTEKRADGDTRTQTLSGYFGILFSRTSPTNVGERTSSGVVLADNARGFIVDLYRSDPYAKVMWLAESTRAPYRSMWEPEIGLKLNKPMDVRVSMIKGVMTVTLIQGVLSATYSHDYSIIEKRAAEGCYIGFGGSSGWWGDDYSVPWVRNRVSNFRAWYRDETDGDGWEAVENADDFSIFDSSKWDCNKVVRTTLATATTNTSTLFTSSGVCLTDSAANNCSYIFSKNALPRLDTPLCLSFRFKTTSQFRYQDENAYISFMFGRNFDNTQRNSCSWNSTALCYSNSFGSWHYGMDWIWDANFGRSTLSEAYSNPGHRNTVTESETYGSIGSTLVAATFPPEKDLRADFVWNPAGTLKSFVSVAQSNHAGDGRSGYRTYSGLAEKTNYATFTNYANSIGIKAVCETNSYAEITLAEFSLKRLAAVVGGEIASVAVTPGATSTIKPGDALPGQTAPVLSVASLGLGAGSTLQVVPENSATCVMIESVSTLGGTISAASGASVTMGDTLVCESGISTTALAVSGDVSFGESIDITVPSSWRKNGNTPIVAIDALAATGALALDPGKVVVRDTDGVIPAKKRHVAVVGNRLLLDFHRGLCFTIK